MPSTETSWINPISTMPSRIIDAAAKWYTQVYEMAEYLDVAKEFQREELAYHGILDISL